MKRYLTMPGSSKEEERAIDWMQKLDEKAIDECIWIALEEIDAGLFTGDVFHNKKDLNELKRYLVRWVREIKNIDKMLKEKMKGESHENI